MTISRFAHTSPLESLKKIPQISHEKSSVMTSNLRIEWIRYGGNFFAHLLPSATKLRQGNIFTSVCQEFCPWGRVCLRACWDTPPADGYCSERYASYWNAYLFFFCYPFNDISLQTSCISNTLAEEFQT